MSRARMAAVALSCLLLTSCGGTLTEEHSAIEDILENDTTAPVTAADAQTTVTGAETASGETGTTLPKKPRTTAAETVTASATSTGTAKQTRTEAKSGGGQTVQIITHHDGGSPAPTVTKPRVTGTTVSGGTTGTGTTSAHKSTAGRTTSLKTTSAKSTTTKTVTTTATEPQQPRDIYERIRAMSLREKAAQMMMSSATTESEALAAVKRGVGAMCLFAGAFSGKSPAQVQQMTANLQAAAKTPVLIAVDEEGGPVNRISLNPQLRSEPFRNSRVIYDAGGWDALRSDTAEKADLLLALGVNVNLGPVCDVPVDPSNYIYARTFGLDPHETADYADVVVSEMKAHRLGSVLKHFPGYGGSIDTHQFMAYDTRDYSAFTEGDFLPFAAGLAAGADAVMVSHNIVTCMDAERPASLSPEVHRILREDFGFWGVIMSDDLGMGAISQYTGGQNPAVAAVLAGNDIVTFHDDGSSVDAIVSAVESGVISEEQINDSVLRIMYWKQFLGLVE